MRSKLQRFLRIISLSMLLVSCKKEESTSQNNGGYSDIKPRKEHLTYQDTISTTSIDLSPWNHDSVHLSIESASVIESNHFLNRFAVQKRRERFELKTTHEIMYFERWEFEDSTSRRRAAFNWFDHFGPDQKSLPWMKRVKLSEGNHLILINRKSILEIQSKESINSKAWINYQRFNFPKDSIVYQIEQIQGKKCQWYRRVSPFNFSPITP